jgi:transcriptional regulator with XRE-family HTH domain
MAKKTVSFEEMLAKRPVDTKRVRKLRDSIIAQSRAVRLADFRKALNLTQVDLAHILGVDQSNISRIERGKLSKTEIGTLESYVQALGGSLEITVRVGKVSHILIDTDDANV